MNIAFAIFCARNNFSIAFPVFLGLLMYNQATFSTVVCLALIYYFFKDSILQSNLLFYLLTNLQCWWDMYEHTWHGFGLCYLLALPFLGIAIVMTTLFCILYDLVYDFCLRKFTVLNKSI